MHSINVARCRGVIFEDAFADAVLSVRSDVTDGDNCKFMAIKADRVNGGYGANPALVGRYGVIDMDSVRGCAIWIYDNSIRPCFRYELSY